MNGKRTLLALVCLFGAACEAEESTDTASEQLALGGPVCDGSEGVRLALTTAPGGPLATDGMDFTAETGGYFAIITGQCVALLQDKIGHPIVRLQLREAEAEALAQSIGVPGWAALSSEQCLYGMDRPTHELLAGGQRLTLGACGETGTEAQPEAIRAVEAFGQALDRLYARGEPTQDLPMRYVLMENQMMPSELFAGAPLIPEGVALTGYEQVQTATGEAAAKLRALYSPGNRHQAVLLQDAEGRELLLYFRDVAEGFEDGRGNWTF